MDYTFFLEWVQFAVRWLHVITAIAWIGSSFYFIALDLGLVPEPGAPKGVHGAAWQVHGGGFYHIQKYLVAPAQMPDRLTWFKWESYMAALGGPRWGASGRWGGHAHQGVREMVSQAFRAKQ